MENKNVYVGHRYVPKIMGEHDKSISYEGLSIVTYQGTSYTSKKYVPVGVDISNNEYWVVTGNYSTQIEQYRKEIKDTELRLENSYNNVINEVDNVRKDLSIDKNKIINIMEYQELADGYGTDVPMNDWDWTIAIQTAINDVVKSREYNVLQFPAGVFKISDDVGYWSDGDIDVGIQIQGSGRSITTGNSTTIHQTNNEKNVLNFVSNRSNLRGLIIKDITLYGGRIGLNLKNNVYDLFENISFSRQTVQNIYSEIGSANYFLNCWAAHSLANFCLLTGAGTEYFIDCKIGEDNGGVSVKDGNAKFINCDFHDVRNRQEIQGMYELGNNIFDIDGGGTLHLENCRVTPNRENCNVVIITNNQRNTKITNSIFNLQHQTFLVSRTQTGTYQGSFNIINNFLTWDTNGKLFENGVGTSSSPIRNSILDGNTFNVLEGFTIETEDWFNRPLLNNQLGLNIFKEIK